MAGGGLLRQTDEVCRVLKPLCSLIGGTTKYGSNMLFRNAGTLLKNYERVSERIQKEMSYS